MHINTAVGEIRCYYLNLPKGDLTEGGKFTGEVLEKLVATARADERAKVLSEVEKMVCPVCGYLCLGKGGYGCIDKVGYMEAKLNQLKEGKC